MSHQTSTENTPGFLHSVATYLKPSNLMQQFQLHKDFIFSICIFFGVGFLVGYFLKKYNRCFAALVFVLLGLVGLEYLDIISISVQWQHIYELFGIQPMEHIHGNALLVYVHWIRTNIFVVASFAAGFFFGLRLG